MPLQCLRSETHLRDARRNRGTWERLEKCCQPLVERRRREAAALSLAGQLATVACGSGAEHEYWIRVRSSRSRKATKTAQQ